MESIYWVTCWACHRKCKHCYDDRFRPYVRGDLAAVIAESQAALPRIVANLPERMRYRVRKGDGSLSGEKVGRIILAGGEPLTDPVREEVLYPALDLLRAKYGRDGARIVVQTTGDLVTPGIVRELVARGVWLVTCAGMDDFHIGMEGDKRVPLIAQIEDAFAQAGVERVGLSENRGDWLQGPGPYWNLMGAVEGSWIGELWPRGRAWANSLSTADMATNFCARQSGAWRFLDTDLGGSEVAIEPNGDLYPCCMKTRRPIGNVAEERLLDILHSLKGHPVFEALNSGRPDLMGASAGWDEAAIRAASATTRPEGQAYANLCIGCDRFFDAVMGPVLAEAKAKRLAARAVTA